MQYARKLRKGDKVAIVSLSSGMLGEEFCGHNIEIGVKEENGIPVFPLEGIPKEELDTIQQEIFQYCNQIVPRYIPKIEVVDYKKQGTI